MESPLSLVPFYDAATLPQTPWCFGRQRMDGWMDEWMDAAPRSSGVSLAFHAAPDSLPTPEEAILFVSPHAGPSASQMFHITVFCYWPELPHVVYQSYVSSLPVAFCIYQAGTTGCEHSLHSCISTFMLYKCVCVRFLRLVLSGQSSIFFSCVIHKAYRFIVILFFFASKFILLKINSKVSPI